MFFGGGVNGGAYNFYPEAHTVKICGGGKFDPVELGEWHGLKN